MTAVEEAVTEAASTRSEAEARADFIRDRMQAVAEFWKEVVTAYKNRDWLALDYPTWDAYLDGEFGEDRIKIPKQQRLTVVEFMHEAGMSTRAIAPALGVGKSTVDRDLGSVPNGTDDQDATVISLDGRQRPARQPAKPDTMTREGWLMAAVDALRPLLTEAGATVPHNIRVSIGPPKKNELGCHYHTSQASDGSHNIFISAAIGNPVDVLDTLVHELVHASDNGASNHRGHFAQVAAAVGVEGSARTGSASSGLREKLSAIAASLGEYPHTAMKLPENSPGSRASKSCKLWCPLCGYPATVPNRWYELAGGPWCPVDNVQLGIDSRAFNETLSRVAQNIEALGQQDEPT